ncbi:MAG TPA: exo-alpha-sialidase, partial [Thermoanaerobaculia bacterium]|nr:exo-alpha-sialidase [Thermoanaerobaculia bacterium]
TPVAAGGVEMDTTFSDNVLTANPPTWSPHVVVAAEEQDGQSTVPRFAGHGSKNAYLVWRRFPFPGVFQGYGNTIGFARSTDSGVTWSAPVDLAPEFFTMDQILGNDRIATSPSLAVDNSLLGHPGNVYVAYSNNDFGDGADVVFQRSTDGGQTFSAPLRINSRPGHDRSQWYPWVAVDSLTGRVWVFYYDQGIDTSGDRSETTVTYSDDGGIHWSAPEPLTDRPFHAAWGNDTGQPNLGDYNQAVAQNGELFAGYAVAFRPPAGFADGQPTSASMTTPDVFFRRVPQFSLGDDFPFGGGASRPTPSLPVNLAAVATTDSGGNGFIDPGETVNLKLTLYNYVTNPLSARKVNGTTARLSTSTTGVTVLQDQSPYSNLDPGATSLNKKDFVLKLSPTFVPGTPIELSLKVRSSENRMVTLLYTLPTGTPSTTTLFSESFDSVAPGTLPAGWTAAHGGGANTVPWTTSSTFCGTGSNGAFHTNANDGPPSGSPTRFERLFSPTFNIPATSSYVTIDFDVCYDTEDDPNFTITAYDGFLVRVTDLTPGRTLRSVLVDAFEDELTTGSLQGFPKHFPRSSNSAYFQDMSAWAGDSQGVRHVRMRLPGMAGSTVQLRFEYTQDGGGICSDVRPGHTCGVLVDNIVVRNVVAVKP